MDDFERPVRRYDDEPDRRGLGGRQLLLVLLFSLAVGFGGGILGYEAASEESVTQTEQLRVIQSEGELIADIAEKVSPSVVSISVGSERDLGFFGSQTLQSSGTGIIVDKDGLVVTNRHVVEGASDISVLLSDGREFEDVEVLGLDQFNDLAYLRIKGAQDLQPAALGNSDETRVGERVIAIGNALGQFANTVTQGIISGTGQTIIAGSQANAETLYNLFQTDAAINPGNSGGPLVNFRGEVIGINTAVAGNAENIGFAIPIGDVTPGIASVRESGELVRPYLGVRYIPITDDVAAELNLDVKRGALIRAGQGQRAIIPGSPADDAGLRDGDIITAINGVELNEENSLVGVIGRQQVGETVTLTILRGDETREVKVELEAVPESLPQ